MIDVKERIKREKNIVNKSTLNEGLVKNRIKRCKRFINFFLTMNRINSIRAMIIIYTVIDVKLSPCPVIAALLFDTPVQ